MSAMESIIAVYLFVLGLCLGSFVLAMVDRMKRGDDWVRGRSQCESCKHTLGIVDLIPLFSWMSTKGRCRYCKERLSWIYPLAELAVGVLFTLSFLVWPNELNSATNIIQFTVWLAAAVLMAGLFIFDMRWFLLPNKLVYPLIGLGAVFYGLGIEQLNWDAVVQLGAALLVGAGIFFLLLVASKGAWIGDGDVRFGVAIALFSGTWILSWLTILVASVLGLLVALVGITLNKGKLNMKSRLPFGPMLIAGLFIVVLFGQAIVDWYTETILLL